MIGKCETKIMMIVTLTNSLTHQVVGHATRSIAMHEVRHVSYGVLGELGVKGISAFILVALVSGFVYQKFVKKKGKKKRKS